MKRIYLLTVLLLTISSQLLAGGFQVSLQGTKQLGLAHAGTGVLFQDASTAFFNPGALGYVTGTKISLSFSPILNNVEFLHENTGKIEQKEPGIGTPFALYTSFKLGEEESVLNKFTFGFGLYTPFGSSVVYEDDWIGRYVTQSITLLTFYAQPTVSYAINDKIGVGVGLVYGLGNFEIKRAIPLADNNGVDGTVNLSGSGGGIGFNVGVFARPIDKLDVGVSFRSATTVAINGGDGDFDVPANVSALFPDTPFDIEITLPYVLTLGASFHATEKLMLTAEWMRTGWSSYDELRFEFDNVIPGLDADVLASKRAYEDNNVFRLAAQYQINDMITVRGGGFYDMSVAPDCCVTPETPDADRYGFMMGASFQFGKLDLDLAYQYLTAAERTTTNEEGQFTGSYDAKVFIPSIGLQYSF